MVGRWTVATIGDRVSDLDVYAAAAESWSCNGNGVDRCETRAETGVRASTRLNPATANSNV